MQPAPRWRWAGPTTSVLLACLFALSAAVSPVASASSQPSPGTAVTRLQALLHKARSDEASLLAQVQTARATIVRDRSRIREARGDLSRLISAEYTQMPGGFLSVIASSSFNSALNTQITLQQLSDAQRGQLGTLESSYQQERSQQLQLRRDIRQEAATEARLDAEEIAAQFQEQLAAEASTTLAAPAASTTHHQIGGSSPSPGASTKPAPSSTPAPTPTPAPTATPPPASPPPPPPPPPPPSGGTGGAFSTTTNLTAPSGITLSQIESFLQGTPLAGDAPYFMAAEQTNHVSAIYLVADAVLETGFGTSQLYLVKHNLFGFQAYDANPYVDGTTFTSDQDCISYVSWYVSAFYLTPPGSQLANYGSLGGTVSSGAFYNGPTPAGMNVDYASDPLWASKIAAIGAALQSIPV